MKNIFVLSAISTVLLASAAGTVSANDGVLEVNASVQATCNISTSGMRNLGEVNPLHPDGGNAARIVSNYDNEININCTQGTPNVVLSRDLGQGLAACSEGGLRSHELVMKSATGHSFPYALFHFNGSRTMWECQGSDSTKSIDFTTSSTYKHLFAIEYAPSSAALQMANQAPAGDYSDTITFKITF